MHSIQLNNLLQKQSNQTFLKKLPLLKQTFLDPSLKIQTRGVDSYWWYSKYLPWRMGGFSPLNNSVYLSEKSVFGEWLKTKDFHQIRYFNEMDNLVFEMFQVMHDSLHIWAYQFIQSHFPDFGFGLVDIDKNNLDDFVFFHILSEVVAVMGSDYWFLCQILPNKILKCGTDYRTVSISHTFEYENEFKRVFLDSTAKSFFYNILDLYCTGSFVGADIKDIKASAHLFKWLNHQMQYSIRQLSYTREWLATFSAHSHKALAIQAGAPLVWRTPRRQAVVKKVLEALWQKVTMNKPAFQKPFQCKWEYNLEKGLDFRFLNLNALKHNLGLRELKYTLKSGQIVGDQRFLQAQLISQNKFNPSTVKTLGIYTLLQGPMKELLSKSLDEENILKTNKDEPLSLFFIN